VRELGEEENNNEKPNNTLGAMQNNLEGYRKHDGVAPIAPLTREGRTPLQDQRERASGKAGKPNEQNKP